MKVKENIEYTEGCSTISWINQPPVYKSQQTIVPGTGISGDCAIF